MAGRKRGSRFCKMGCRQAAWRFGRGAGELAAAAPAAPGQQMRFGYADPPYRRKAFNYVGHPDYAGEVDQAELIGRLVDEFPDGWALSASAESLGELLEYCPRDVQVGAWVRGARLSDSYRPLSAWEPVIYRGGRAELRRHPDALVHGVTARTSDPKWVIGAKPAEFSYWMFGLLGMAPGDELVDLYPGSGGVARAWAEVNRLAAARDVSAPGGRDAKAPAGRDATPGSARDGSAVATRDGSTVVERDGSGDVDRDACTSRVVAR